MSVGVGQNFGLAKLALISCSKVFGNGGFQTLISVKILVSLSPAQAQPLGQAKVAIISASFSFFLPLIKNLIKGLAN